MKETKNDRLGCVLPLFSQTLLISEGMELEKEMQSSSNTVSFVSIVSPKEFCFCGLLLVSHIHQCSG